MSAHWLITMIILAFIIGTYIELRAVRLKQNTTMVTAELKENLEALTKALFKLEKELRETESCLAKMPKSMLSQNVSSIKPKQETTEISEKTEKSLPSCQKKSKEKNEKGCCEKEKECHCTELKSQKDQSN